MEKGSKVMARMLLGAVVIGAVVMAFHPEYRELFGQLRRGTPALSAIWRSNEGYYPAVGATAEEDAHAE